MYFCIVFAIFLLLDFVAAFHASSSTDRLCGPCLPFAIRNRRNTFFLRSRLTRSFLGDQETVEKLKKKLLQMFDSDDDVQGNIYACPESLQPLTISSRNYGTYTERFLTDKEFGAKYAIQPDYLDLVAPVGHRDTTSRRLGQWAFQTTLISKLYEHGYRQGFKFLGFPGMEDEFSEAENFFRDAKATDIVLDLSCGTGWATRKFLSSASFARVIAADLSPTMLRETLQNCRKDGIDPPELVRCDSAKLPFRSNSISAVHAGAAMHVWPEVQRSLIDIHRVLRPGGAFYATTVTQPRLFFNRPSFLRKQGFSVFHSAEEIEDIVRDAGFVDCQVRHEGSRCVVVKALKPPSD